jgi:putative ABC transport system substrate-binding protein
MTRWVGFPSLEGVADAIGESICAPRTNTSTRVGRPASTTNRVGGRTHREKKVMLQARQAAKAALIVVLSLPALAPAAHAQAAPALPIAYDGRNLLREPFATQATFQTVWAERAESRWVEEHNAELTLGRPLSGPRIVYFTTSSASTPQGRDAFVAGLRTRGYNPGQNMAIDWRYTEGRTDVVDAVAAEVIGLRPDLIVTTSTPETLALKKATTSIPIVFTSLGDPIGAGVVPSLEQPGGNLTGMSITPPRIQAQRLALLKEAVPAATRVGVLRNSSNPSSAGMLRELRDAADSMGLQIEVLDVERVPENLAAAFDLAAQTHIDAVIEVVDVQFNVYRSRIVELATQARRPLMVSGRTAVEAGALMSYAPKTDEPSRRAAGYVAKILGGAKPADLPVGVPLDLELVLNQRVAQAIGFTFPAATLARATDVIR